MPTPPLLILASSSPYKRRLLARLGIEFRAQGADIDEDRRPGETPRAMTRRLAEEKALAVAQKHGEAFVLGGDQVIAVDDRIFEKPVTKARAVDHLKALQGRTHRLINSVYLKYPAGPGVCSTQIYEMVMRPLDEDQIRRYVDTDSPLDCAGAYRIEAAGIRLFEATCGDDPTAIEGLPLIRVWNLLLDAGWPHE